MSEQTQIITQVKSNEGNVPLGVEAKHVILDSNYGGAFKDTTHTNLQDKLIQINRSIPITARSGLATGHNATALGMETKAKGDWSFAEGYQAVAENEGSHAEGLQTTAKGKYSHTEGEDSIAYTVGSHAEGKSTQAGGSNGTASESYAHAEGVGTVALGRGSHAEGVNTQAQGSGSHAEGRQDGDEWTVAMGPGSHAEGGGTRAKGDNSHSEGTHTVAEGHSSHAEGYQTKAQGIHSHAEGYNTLAKGDNAHAEGDYTRAIGKNSHAEGSPFYADGGAVDKIIYINQTGYRLYSSWAEGEGSHAEGVQTFALGKGSHAEGIRTEARGEASHAEGYQTTAQGDYSHAEGFDNIINGIGSHIEGYGNNIALNVKALHIEGIGNNAEIGEIKSVADINISLEASSIPKINSLSQPIQFNGRDYYYYIVDMASRDTLANILTSKYDLAIGQLSLIARFIGAVEVYNVLALIEGPYAVYYLEKMPALENSNLSSVHTATFYPSQLIKKGLMSLSEGAHIQGKYAIIKEDYAHIVGGGESLETKKNIHTLDWNGNAEFAGDVIAYGCGGKPSVKLSKLKPLTEGPLIIEEEYKNNYNNKIYGDMILKSINAGQQILIQLINKGTNNTHRLYSPVITYHLPKDNDSKLSLFYLPDQANIADPTSLFAEMQFPVSEVLFPTYTLS